MYIENGHTIFDDPLLVIEADEAGYAFYVAEGEKDDIADILLDCLYQVTHDRAVIRRLGFKVLKGGLG